MYKVMCYKKVTNYSKHWMPNLTWQTGQLGARGVKIAEVTVHRFIHSWEFLSHNAYRNPVTSPGLIKSHESSAGRKGFSFTKV
jgi:hypothetical protein